MTTVTPPAEATLERLMDELRDASGGLVWSPVSTVWKRRLARYDAARAALSTYVGALTDEAKSPTRAATIVHD